MIKNNFRIYFEKNLAPKKLKLLISDALFSFQMALEVCLEMAEQDEENAKRYFEKCLDSIIEEYLKFGDPEYYKNFNLENRVKIHILANYVKSSFIERILIHYAQKVGTKEICDVSVII